MGANFRNGKPPRFGVYEINGVNGGVSTKRIVDEGKNCGNQRMKGETKVKP